VTISLPETLVKFGTCVTIGVRTTLEKKLFTCKLTLSVCMILS